MVHLTYVENPFDKDFLTSLSKYAEEKSFYDCINKKFVDEEAFKNLEYGFHMYMLTGDSNEWIGFVLFSNENKVKGLRYCACKSFFEVLNRLEKYVPINELEKIKTYVESIEDQNYLFTIIDECFEYLSKFVDIELINLERENYKEKLNCFLNDFTNYMYLDTFISLPIDEKIKICLENESGKKDADELVEKKYYGFIQETLGLVENLINSSFTGKHIILKPNGKNIFLVETSSFIKNEELSKVLIMENNR